VTLSRRPREGGDPVNAEIGDKRSTSVYWIIRLRG
jgi:hypothetical protein